MNKQFNIYFKCFWGKGKKPSLLSFDQVGVGNQVQVTADESDKAEVQAKLTSLFAERPSLKLGELRYDSAYGNFSTVILGASRSMSI